MLPEINYWAVILATLSSMVVGSIWYTPKVFGNYRMKKSGVTMSGKAKRCFRADSDDGHCKFHHCMGTRRAYLHFLDFLRWHRIPVVDRCHRDRLVGRVHCCTLHHARCFRQAPERTDHAEYCPSGVFVVPGRDGRHHRGSVGHRLRSPGTRPRTSLQEIRRRFP